LELARRRGGAAAALARGEMAPRTLDVLGEVTSGEGGIFMDGARSMSLPWFRVEGCNSLFHVA